MPVDELVGLYVCVDFYGDGRRGRQVESTQCLFSRRSVVEHICQFAMSV